MFDYDETKCPKCGRNLAECAVSLEDTKDILENGIMEWTCPCGNVIKEELSPEEIIELEEETFVLKDDKARGK